MSSLPWARNLLSQGSQLLRGTIARFHNFPKKSKRQRSSFQRKRKRTIKLLAPWETPKYLIIAQQIILRKKKKTLEARLQLLKQRHLSLKSKKRILHLCMQRRAFQSKIFRRTNHQSKKSRTSRVTASQKTQRCWK